MGEPTNNPDGPKTEKTFKELLQGMAEDSSLHGVPKIVSSRQIPVKILWCLLFLTTFVVLVIQIYNLFVTFNAYPIQTSVALEFSPLVFPAVTICNMNPIRRSYVSKSQNIKDIIYPKVKRKKTTTTGTSNTNSDTSTRKKRHAKSQDEQENGGPKHKGMKHHSSKTKEWMEEKEEQSADKSFHHEDYNIEDVVLLGRLRREVPLLSDAPDSSGASSDTINPSATVSDESVSIDATGAVDTMSSSISYFYEYDYWGSFWGSDTGSSGDFSGTGSGGSGDWYEEWADWYNQNDYDYGDYSSHFGAQNYLFDQYFSPKDQWDERIVNFQTVFRNETTDLRQSMGHRREDVIVGATFVRTVQNITAFEEFTTSEYGNCYTMTSPKYKAWRSGPAHGIKLTLNLEVDEYIENFATGYGIRVVFHAPGTYPLASEEGLTLSPGYETSVGLRMVQISRLGQPYGECSDGVKFKEQYGIGYSTAACMQFCRVRKAIEICKCIPHDAPDINFGTGRNVCLNSGADKLCIIQVDVKFDDGSYTEECDCKSPCQETLYEKTMSGRRWPNDDYLKNVLLLNACSKNISSIKDACEHIANKTFSYELSEKYRNNFLQLLVYYEDLNYEKIMQEPLYEPVRFLSDIGGAMGLFMGASLLSFVEFLQLGLEIVLFFWKKMMNTQHIGPISSNPRKSSYFHGDKSGNHTPVSMISDPKLVAQ